MKKKYITFAVVAVIAIVVWKKFGAQIAAKAKAI
jgi:hypothetical protein